VAAFPLSSPKVTGNFFRESSLCLDKYFLEGLPNKDMTSTRAVNIYAFSYAKGGPPAEAKLPGSVVIDCRVLPNVWKDRSLRGLSGKDQRVMDWLYVQSPLQVNYLQDQAMKAARKDKASNVYFGCQHGKHRSVAMAVEFAARLLASNPQIKDK
jgi:RNase adaptor protein for sRNA GlmZ degradation